MVVVHNDHNGLAPVESWKTRLENITFLIGDAPQLRQNLDYSTSQEKEQSIFQRLQHIQVLLHKTSKRSHTIQNILTLSRSHLGDISQPFLVDNFSTSLDIDRPLLVKSYAPLYYTTATRLVSVQDLLVSATTSSAAITALIPRLAQAEALQRLQEKTLATLEARTASILKLWYELRIIREGYCWVEWEDRMMKAERSIRQIESSRL